MILEADNIHKSYSGPGGSHVLKGISLSLKARESIAIMGRSGEGKSTLLQILGTLDLPDRGSLIIGGEEAAPSRFNELRSKRIGFIFQSFFLLEDFTVLENLLMPSRIARVPCGKGSAAYSRAMTLLERVGMSEHANQPAKQLSGGEKQRVAFARALCNDPMLILADEPTGNLDYTTAESIHHLLMNLVKEEGKTLVIVTHNQELANMCDRQYILREGLLHSHTPN